MKELTGQLQLSEVKCADIKEDAERLKKELAKAESVETELRRTTEQYSRTSNEYQMLRDQVRILEHSRTSSNNDTKQFILYWKWNETTSCFKIL